MPSYPSPTLGTLERLQDYWEIHLSLGLRFALVALAMIALVTSLKDITEWLLEFRGLRSVKNVVPSRVRIASYINRLLISMGVLAAAPAGFWRLGHRDIDPDFAFSLQMTSSIFFILYLLTDELVRLLAHGTPVKSAWYRCIPLGIAALLLLFVGVNLDVRY